MPPCPTRGRGPRTKSMSEAANTEQATINELVDSDYKYGFYTDIETDAIPPGLNEDIVRLISEKKGEPEFMLRSEEHTSELQSRGHLVCRLLLEKKKNRQKNKN